MRFSLGRLDGRAESLDGGEGIPLAILSTPKPTTTQFYLLNPQGQPDGRVDYDTPIARLRGRKFYRHHGEEPSRYGDGDGDVEYRRVGDQQDDQNRTVHGVLQPGTAFTFTVDFENLAPLELGALLWALQMEEGMHHRLGYGKPLGFGSARVIIGPVHVWEPSERYASLEDSGQKFPSEKQLREFSAHLAKALGQPDRAFADWNEALLALAELTDERRFVVVFDEYPYLAESVPGFSTLLQRAWDTCLQHTRLFLCLTGSAHSVVRREILDGDAPLYRRHTWAYELPPLQPADLSAFFPAYNPEQVIEAYAVLGGMPRNLVAMDARASLLRNVERELLNPAGSLFNEVRLLLHEELKGEVAVFGRVLEAIAAGSHQRRDIARAANLTLAAAQHYLAGLQAAGLVQHRLPLTRVREEPRQGTYHILDPFLRFWHRWLAPHHPLLEINQRRSETLGEIRNNLPYIVAPVWETLARQHLLVASGQGQIPFPVHEVGDWWTRGAQVDLVGVNRAERRVVFGEARWRAAPLTTADLDALAEKGLLWLRGDTSRWDVHYAFFARRFGQVQAAGLAEGFVHLFTPADLVRAE